MIRIEFNKLGVASEEIYVNNISTIKNIEDNQVLIEVLLFPINPADLLLVEGKYSDAPSLPSTIGAECIARVKKIGSKVKKFKENDIVLPLVRDNWVEEKKVNENEIIKLPTSIDLVQASMLKVNPATAYLMLNNYININKNDYILQNAANSGVGNYVIQLANMYNIRTINLVRRLEVGSLLKKYGADHVFNINLNDKEKDFIKKAQPKLFIDALAGMHVNNIASLLANNSTIINYGLLSGENIQLDPHNTIFKDIMLKGFWLSLWLSKMSLKEKHNLYLYLSELIIKNKIHTKVEKIFHIKNIKDAIKLASNYSRKGKILVTTSDKFIQ